MENKTCAAKFALKFGLVCIAAISLFVTSAFLSYSMLSSRDAAAQPSWHEWLDSFEAEDPFDISHWAVPMTREDVFISDALLQAVDFDGLLFADIPRFNDIPFPNFRLRNRLTYNHEMPFATLLYVIHEDRYGEMHLFVYGATYGFQCTNGLGLNEDVTAELSRLYLRELGHRLEAITLEDMEKHPLEAMTEMLGEMRSFADYLYSDHGAKLFFSFHMISQSAGLDFGMGFLIALNSIAYEMGLAPGF